MCFGKETSLHRTAHSMEKICFEAHNNPLRAQHVWLENRIANICLRMHPCPPGQKYTHTSMHPLPASGTNSTHAATLWSVCAHRLLSQPPRKQSWHTVSGASHSKCCTMLVTSSVACSVLISLGAAASAWTCASTCSRAVLAAPRVSVPCTVGTAGTAYQGLAFRSHMPDGTCDTAQEKLLERGRKQPHLTRVGKPHKPNDNSRTEPPTQ